MMTALTLMQRNIETWTQTMQAAQKSWMQFSLEQTEHYLGAQAPSAEPRDAAQARQIEDAFQTAANFNLKAWTHMAETIAALPNWMHWPSNVPGRAMTDLFDMMRPFPEFAAEPETREHKASSEPQPNLRPAQTLLTVSADDLTQIKGIGPKMANKLNAAGIHAVADIASLTVARIEELEGALSMMTGRIKRQDWIQQAKALG